MKRKRNGKMLAGDRHGALEGLPLYMVILVLITGVATSVLLGWLSQPQANAIGEVYVTPQNIKLSDDNNDGLYSSSDIEITVIVKDSDGNPLPRASVHIEGMGIHTTVRDKNSGNFVNKDITAQTDQNGKVHFTGLSISDAISDGELEVKVHKSGYGTKVVSVPVYLNG